MDRSALEKYHASVMAAFKMYKEGIIDEKDFAKAEKYLAKKYSISKGNLYRLNNLICTPERAIQYCKLASEYNTAHKYKPFIYLFVPENQFDSTTTFNTIKDRFSNN